MNFLPGRSFTPTGRGIGRALLGLGALMSLAMISASAQTNETGEYIFTSTTDPYAILAFNNNTASGSFGIQANDAAAAGAGVYGYSDVVSGAVGYGVAGISQTGYGVYGSSYGSGISAIYAENLGTGGGIGLQGTSAYGVGVNGLGAQNGVVGTSIATSGTYAGVLGVDNSNAGSGGDAYGVAGDAVGSDTAVGGFAAGSGDAVYANGAANGFAVEAASNTNTAIDAYTGITTSGGAAQIGAATGEGGIFYGFSGTSADPVMTAFDEVGGTDLLGTYTFNSGSPAESFIVQAGTEDASGDPVPSDASDVQVSGDLYVGGEVFTDCSEDDGGVLPATDGDCGNEFVAKSATGAKMRTYTAKQSTNTIEDVGEAKLVDGHAYVPLEANYASSIARDRTYMAFITPEGDSNGLYIAGKTLSGFTVRESRGGHSTLAFEYRLVAHPYGDSGVRIAAIAPRTKAFVRHLSASQRMLVKKRFIHMQHRPVSIGARITRPPHNWAKNMHRN
jgi:hypothetical protein